MSDVEYSILGPLTVRLAPDSAPVVLGEKLRLLLGRLLLEPGVALTVDCLADAVWGDEERLANPTNSVHVAIAQLRKRLGDTDARRHVLIRVGSGYRLVVPDPLRIDAQRFKRLARRGRVLMERYPWAARAMLGEALAMWRGPLLDEHARLRWAAGHAAELASMRANAEADLNEARLTLGEHVQLEGALRRQIVEHPDDERRRAQLIRALDAAGRAAEAALAYRDAARDLGALGSDLRRLGERIGRGLPADPPRATAATAPVGGCQEGALLCAVIAPPARHPGEPDLGTLALVVDRHGGEPYPPRIVPRERASGGHELLGFFDAVDAAVAAAGAIASDSRLRAAVAVHAGVTVPVGDRLAGPAPARCRLLTRAAHRGQVLISSEARAALGPEADVRDTGAHRLEDLLAAEPVFELGARAPSRGFPPPKTLNRKPHNLPVQLTRFVGRHRELEALSDFVAAGRLLTLLGVGGCGKTRLALQLAARRIDAFPDGAWFVGLAELETGSNGEALALAIGGTLGVRPLRKEPASAALVRHLSDRAALLVIDNCEHVLGACAEVIASVREQCTRVGVIATSRQPLRLDGEQVAEVPGMASDLQTESDTLPEAVELLLERAGPLPAASARSADALLDATRICRAFEGSPLAIELAAAHAATRGISALAAEVESMLRGELGLEYFESADPHRPPRQRTIKAAIRWSHALLTPRQQKVLHRLAVFRGTFGLREAQIIASDATTDTTEVAEVVRNLVDHCLVTAETPLAERPRLRLGEPIRAFALAQLEPEDREATRSRHARVFCALAVDTAPSLFGPGEQVALERLEADHDNMRAALAWRVHGGHSDEALELVGALWWLWFSHGHFAEGSTWIKDVLAIDDTPSRRRVRALRAGSHLAWWQGDYEKTEDYNHQLATCAGVIDDAWGLAWAQMGVGAVQMFAAPERALQHFEESRRRFQALGRHWEAAYALQIIGGAHWFAGDEHAAGEAYEEAADIFERLGHGSVLASARRGAGLMAARCGHPERGAALCREALRSTDAMRDRAGSAQALNFLAAIDRDERHLDTAVQRYAGALSLAREVGELWATCLALDGIAGAACSYGDCELAARLLACSERLARRSRYRQSPHEQRLREADTRITRNALGEPDFERATAEGQVMSVGDAVTAALAFAARHP